MSGNPVAELSTNSLVSIPRMTGCGKAYDLVWIGGIRLRHLSTPRS